MSYANGPSPSLGTAEAFDDEEWLVTADKKAWADNAFGKLDKDEKGQLTQQESTGFFASSKLPEHILQSIWRLADINDDGYINPEEFAVAVFLVQEQRKVPGGTGSTATLPASLPRSLIPPSMRPPPVEKNKRESGIDWDWDSIDLAPRPVRSPPTPSMRRDDGFDKQMSLCFPDLKKPNPKPFSERNCSRISDLLRQLGKMEWSRIPRTYAVLKMVNQVQAMDAFLCLGCTDMWFPYEEASLPQALGSRHARTKFLELQPLVLSTGHDLENMLDKKHRYVGSSEDLPFRVLEELGQGGFGSVDKIESLLSFNVYARKKIHRKRNFKGNQQVIADFERELATLQRISHRHIIELVGSYTDHKFVGLIMSPVCDSDLETYLTMQTLSRAQKSHLRTFYGCLTAALLYLHDNHIRHKDIKPRNILVHRNQVFLTDFGLARDSSEQTRSTTTGRPSALSTRYAAPEVASWDARSYSADIYSLGAVFLEMTTVLIGRSPKDLRSFMAIHGTRETPFWTNEVGFLEWTDLLNQTAEDESDTLPLTWIPGMMDNKRDHRPTARGLFTEISEPSVEVKYLFCGTCCADDDSTESVRSSGGSIEATVQDTGDETTVETRSDAKRPSPSESQTELTIDDEDELEPDSEPELADEKRPERMGPSPAFSQHDEGGSPQPPPARFDGPDGSETQEIEDDETQTVTPAPHRTADSDDIKKYRLGEIIPRDPNHPAATSEQYERHYHRYLELRTDPATNLQLAFNAYLIHLEQQLQWDRASSSQASIEIPPTIEIPPSILPEPRSASAEPEVKRSPALLSPDESARKHTRSASDSRRHAIMISAVQPWIPSVWPVEIDGEEIYPENRMVRTMRVNSPEDWTVSWPEDAYEKLAASPYISALDILILAIRRRHVSQIAWLLEKSPGSKMSDARGWSPLHYAAAYGDVEIMTMLVRAGFKFWADKDGTQPIHLAVQNGHLAAVRYLISLGANLDARDAHGVQAVRLAPNHMDVAFYDIRPEFELDGKVLSRDQLLANTRPNTDLKSLHLWNLDRNLILIHASRTGNINEVCSILAGEFDPHFVDAAGYSALHFAASFGHDQTCQLLLTAGFDSQLQSASGGFRPIHYANLYLDKLLLEQDSDGKRLSWQEECRMDGYRNTVKFLQQDKSHLSLLNTHAKGLLKAPPGTPVDIITNHAIQNFELEQDLRLAAGSGNTDQLLKCIQNGADVNGSDLLRETALHKAAASGYVEVVKILVAAGGNLEMIDIQGRSPLYKAVLNNHDAAVAYMCLQNAPMLTGSKKKEPAFQQNPQRNSEILSLAARVGNIAVVWQQLLKGADVNWKMPNSSTALHEAVLGQHEQIVRELIKVGANLRAPNDDGKLAINLAFESSQQGLCLLLQNAARDSTALESSVRKGDMSNTLQLLDNGVSARGFDTEGFTLLHHASILGYPGITAALIEKGAFVDTKVPEFGFTPLHYAIKKRHPAIVGLLVANGADIDARGPALQTPLMMAVLAENIPALTLLIEKGAELNAQDDSGSTALKHAMVARFPEGVKVLYDSGAASNDETITCEAIESYLEESFSKSTKPPSPSFPSFGLSADELATAITEEKPLDFPQLRSGAKGVMRSLEMFIRSRDRSAGKQS